MYNFAYTKQDILMSWFSVDNIFNDMCKSSFVFLLLSFVEVFFVEVVYICFVVFLIQFQVLLLIHAWSEHQIWKTELFEKTWYRMVKKHILAPQNLINLICWLVQGPPFLFSTFIFYSLHFLLMGCKMINNLKPSS